MVTVGLLVRLEAKPGKEADVERFLEGGLALVNEEPDTTAWFAVRMGPSSYGIFDVFPSDAGRRAHLQGRVARSPDGPGSGPLQRTTRHRPARRARGQAARLKARSTLPGRQRSEAVNNWGGLGRRAFVEVNDPWDEEHLIRSRYLAP